MIAQPADPPPAVSARQAMETLRRAGAVLTATLAYDVTLRRVTRLVVPDVADWCAVLVIHEDGSEHEITSEHPDPEIERTLRAIRRRRRRRGRGGRESLDVLASGRPILATSVADMPAPDLDPHERDVMARLGPSSYMIVPLMARGRTIGA